MNKENVIRSKIPIPVDPLPPMPENILRQRETKAIRQPLETIFKEVGNSDNVLSNNATVEINNGKGDIITIDTRNVTIRSKIKALHYDVYNESLNNSDVGESSKTASTPTVQSPLIPCRVKNVKKSLKRPHSRELQGISPLAAPKNEEEKHKRRLDFVGPVEDKFVTRDICSELCTISLNHDYGQDFLRYLIQRESLLEKGKIPRSTRACIVNWLIKINGRGRNPSAVQTATCYFDNMLMESKFEVGQLQVVATACYWISLKLHGGLVSAKSLVKISDDAFSIKLLLATERKVLSSLKFPIQPVLPQEFITHLSWKYDTSNSSEIEVVATIVHMAGYVIYKTKSQYPSVLAVAAVENALLLLNKKELLQNFKMDMVYKAAEKKSDDFSEVRVSQREALRKMASPKYLYNAVLRQYDAALVQKIVTAAKFFTFSDQDTLKKIYKIP